VVSEILRVDGLVKQFGGNRAVDGATFTVERGSVTGLIGPNGAGKTTCFNCISGFERPDAGTLTFDGSDITGLAPHRVVARRLTRTFQIPHELSAMTVLENLMLARRDQIGERLWESWFRPGRVAREERQISAAAHEVLDLVDLKGLAHERAGNLSGGQRKLLELARALMANPEMILLDEPGAGVNPTLARRLVTHIRRIQQEMGVTFLVIAHDMDLIAQLCDPVVVMTNGQVLTEGHPDEVLADSNVQAAYLGSQYR
jgi:branched-chain amino acid transport system ATP-binding protein